MKDHVAQLRENILKHYAPIKTDSALTPKLVKFFEELHGRPYYNEDSHILLGKWFDTSIEEDALHAQMRADFEFSQSGCFMKYANDSFVKMEQRGDVDKMLAQLKAERDADKAAEAIKNAAKE